MITTPRESFTAASLAHTALVRSFQAALTAAKEKFHLWRRPITADDLSVLPCRIDEDGWEHPAEEPEPRLDYLRHMAQQYTTALSALGAGDGGEVDAEVRRVLRVECAAILGAIRAIATRIEAAELSSQRAAMEERTAACRGMTVEAYRLRASAARAPSPRTGKTARDRARRQKRA